MPKQEEPVTASPAPWSRGRRLMLSLPIFVILMALLVTISGLTTVPWNNEPTGQTFATLSPDTAVTFANPDGIRLDARGDYQVSERYVTMSVARDGSLVAQADGRDPAPRPASAAGQEIQDIRVLVREPVGAAGGRPGVVFMHGAGYGSCDDSFGDVARDLASAGFVTAVLDKPVWSTTDLDRDYPASAKAYDLVIDYLRSLPGVDAGQVGIYATSESTWISGYLLADDPDVAFQVLLSPMVYSPRHALGFFVSQDFALVGAHDGYQSIVRRVFSIDSGMLGFANFDISVLDPATYAIPTFIAYGSKDVMTAQVEGAEAMVTEAQRAGNRNMTIRSYPIANHVLRLGDEAQSDTPFADRYVDDLIDWAVGTTHGLTQTSERVAGATIYQSIAVPTGLRPNRAGTIYGLALHALMILSLLAAAVTGLVALGRWIWRTARRRSAPALGYAHGFGGMLLTVTLATLAALVVFGAGLGQVVMGVVHLAWGAAPAEDPGVMQWSWPFIEVVCTAVVWAWSRVIARLIEVSIGRGVLRWPPSRGAIAGIVTGREPVIAATRLGRALFWITSFAMFSVLLVFAFWGLFVY
ncbi:alpha/beta hydrolase [Bifidobacterium pullorum subsp. saeculare]|uniref:Alpha/beta hydrolase n=1 Tax=Bifidobacterium pullorum subsp. saeculare TaxID=78257 RepID=A0A938WWG1_9BIFI|nr:alpha/beta hydrolase [Bifidobacterium pullorum subsp. saeculare]